MNFFLPLLEAWNESNGGIFSIFGSRRDPVSRNCVLAKFMRLTAYLNAVSCFMSPLSNKPPENNNILVNFCF